MQDIIQAFGLKGSHLSSWRFVPSLGQGLASAYRGYIKCTILRSINKWEYQATSCFDVPSHNLL